MTTVAELLGGLATRASARAFHPDLRLLSRVLPSGIVVGPRSLQVARRALGRPTDDGTQERAGTVPVLVHRPAAGPVRGAVLWIHGGGMVMGAPGMDAALCRRMADELGAVVVAPDYRLAPEHPYPAPLDDCYEALRWTAALREVAEVPVVVAGASAGGGLAAGVVLAARDRGDVTVAGQVLVYPMLDDRTASRPDPGAAQRRVWDNTSNAFGWRAYLSAEPGAADVPAYAAPARAQDLHGLPPTWIGVGTADLFHDEDLDHAVRLREAGVECDLLVVPGAFHGFDAIPTPVSRSFVDEYVTAVGRMLTNAG